MENNEVTNNEVPNSTQAPQENPGITPVVESNTETPVQNLESSPSASVNVEDSSDFQIPEKLVGKDPIHIIKNYVEVEKHAGKLATELDEARRKVQEYEQYKAQVEQQNYNSQFAQQQVAQLPVASQAVKTPEDLYQEEWDLDPKQAALNYTLRKQQQLVQSMTTAQTTEFYNQAKSGVIKGMEDFKNLEPLMTEYARQIAPYVIPEMRTSPVFVKALHLMARGATLDQVVDKATKNAVTSASAKLVQKESAFAEGSSSSSGDRNVKFEDLSLSEMRKLLPVSQMVE